MKKEYMKPQVEVIDIEFESNMLQASVGINEEDADQDKFKWND